MNVSQKRQRLDSFARKISGVVTKYLCFGTYQNADVCKTCSVHKQCKRTTPKGAGAK